MLQSFGTGGEVSGWGDAGESWLDFGSSFSGVSAVFSIFLRSSAQCWLNELYEPGYRGIFLRGQGSQTSTHYGTVTHSSAALGQLQGDGIRTIWGTFVGGDWSGHNNQGGSSGAFWPSGNAGVQEGNRYDQIRYSFDVSRVTPVVGEVRPVNRAVRYLIRAR